MKDPIYACSDTFKQLPKCSGGHRHYSIAVNGDIFPCSLLIGNEEFKLGNTHTGINSDKINQVDKINFSESVCGDCALNAYCVSERCRLVNLATTGDFRVPNLINCKMMNVKYEISREYIES